LERTDISILLYASNPCICDKISRREGRLEVQRESTAVGTTPWINCLVTGDRLSIISLNTGKIFEIESRSNNDEIAVTMIVLKNIIKNRQAGNKKRELLTVNSNALKHLHV
jgi:hypothetical protein